MAKAQAALYSTTSVSDKANIKARCELMKMIPKNLHNRPFEIENLDDNTDDCPRRSSPQRSEFGVEGSFIFEIVGINDIEIEI